MLFVDPCSEVYINIPNMSLAYAATMYNTKVIDQHVLPYPRDRFMKHKAKTLGISVRSFAFKEANRIVQKYSGKNPGSRIKSIDALDVQCCYPFLNLSERISLKKDFSDQLPFPRYELFDSYNYMSTNWRIGLWHYPLLSTLGCPYQCTFCASRNRKYKMRSVDNCVSELRQAKDKYRIVSFEIIDDVFNLSASRVTEFCKKVRPLKLSWLCSNGLRADKFDEDQAKELRSAGCTAVGFGIESIHDDVLESIKKGETRAQIEKAVKVARKHFTDVKAYFIIGLPGSTHEKDLASIKWAQANGIKPIASYYVPGSDEVSADSDGKERIFYGSKAKACSGVYPVSDQKKVYQLSKKQVRTLYKTQKLPLHLIWLTLRALGKYNLKSMLTHFIIGPKRFLSIIFKGEVQ